MIVGGLAALVATLLVSGFAYETIASTLDRRAMPAPGALFDVGGHQLHLACTGQGSPTVDSRNRLGATSSAWALVQPAVASSTRACAYDRAGLGWSRGRSGAAGCAAHQLRAARAAPEGWGSWPYVLVGHSYGGLVVRAFADRYPDEVVGLVLVDASHPDQWLHIPLSMRGAVPGLANRVTAMLAAGGLLRVWDPLTPQIAMGLPEHPYAEMRAIIALPRTSWTGAQTLAVWDQLTRSSINGGRGLGDMPLAVLSVTGAAAGRRNP